MAVAQQTLPLNGITPHRTENYRSDHFLVSEMVAPGSKVLDVGCGEGDLLLIEAVLTMALPGFISATAAFDK